MNDFQISIIDYIKDHIWKPCCNVTKHTNVKSEEDKTLSEEELTINTTPCLFLGLICLQWQKRQKAARTQQARHCTMTHAYCCAMPLNDFISWPSMCDNVKIKTWLLCITMIGLKGLPERLQRTNRGEPQIRILTHKPGNRLCQVFFSVFI